VLPMATACCTGTVVLKIKAGYCMHVTIRLLAVITHSWFVSLLHPCCLYVLHLVTHN
jgi:hypothetical protein